MKMTADNSSIILNRIKSVFKAGGVYLSFSLLNRAIPFLLLPLLTRYIDPSGYGVVSVITVVASIAMPIIGMCSNSVLYQRYFKLDPMDRSYFINDSYKIIVMTSIVLSLVAITCAPFIESYLKITLGWFEVAIICAAAGMVSALTTSLFQIKKEAVSYGFFQTAAMLTNVGLTLLFVVLMDLSWQGRIWAMLISSLLVALLALYLNLRGGLIDISRMRHSPQMSTIFRLGGALIPSTIAGWAMSMSDRVFLTSMTTLDLVGIYSVGVMIGQITDVFLNSIGQAYLPYLFQHGYSSDFQTRFRIVQVIYIVTAVSLATALIVSLMAPMVINLMVNSRYQSATMVVGWISLSYAFIAIGSAFHGLILAVEKNMVTIYVSALTLAVNLIGNYLLIGRFGMVGAAMGNALSSFTFMSLLFLASLRYNRMPWFDRRVLGLTHSYKNSR